MSYIILLLDWHTLAVHPYNRGFYLWLFGSRHGSLSAVGSLWIENHSFVGTVYWLVVTFNLDIDPRPYHSTSYHGVLLYVCGRLCSHGRHNVADAGARPLCADLTETLYDTIEIMSPITTTSVIADSPGAVRRVGRRSFDLVAELPRQSPTQWQRAKPQ